MINRIPVIGSAKPACPVCDVRRSLRVNLSLQTALCVECREVWDSTTIGLLAEHIRAENMEDEDAHSA
jgi:Zn-finger nucleic acid-binding protein